MLKSIMSAGPIRPLSEARVPMGEAMNEYSRHTGEAMQAHGNQPLSESDMTREMARADAKQFADILRNWIK